jgi:lysozyme
LITINLVGCRDESARRKDYEIEGVDISKYQMQIDWQAVAKQNFAFAFVKATEGGNLADIKFKQNWYTIKQVGMRRGAYHFFRPQVNALAQAKNFMDVARLEVGDLPPVLDAEEADGVEKELIVARMQTWLDIVEKKYDVKPIIYTSQKFYTNYIIGNFDSYPIWIAKYSVFKPSFVNENQLTFWQYTNKGKVEGIDGNVDLNVFTGTKTDFEKMLLKPKMGYTMKE